MPHPHHEEDETPRKTRPAHKPDKAKAPVEEEPDRDQGRNERLAKEPDGEGKHE